jgi:hypothetical protein
MSAAATPLSLPRLALTEVNSFVTISLLLMKLNL